jgi:hypothetical protein
MESGPLDGYSVTLWLDKDSDPPTFITVRHGDGEPVRCILTLLDGDLATYTPSAKGST